MSTPMDVVEHPTRRLTVTLPGGYEQARQHYEELVPEADMARFLQAASWQEHQDLIKRNAPHGFMRYLSFDLTPAMVAAGTSWQATQYLMGNHTTAARMFRHDPAVMLHAPLRVLLYSGPDGGAKLALDQPGLLFAGYGNPDIAAVGRELDVLVADLIALLGGPPVTLPLHVGPADLKT
jgi:Domain of unknown function DUF302